MQRCRIRIIGAAKAVRGDSPVLVTCKRAPQLESHRSMTAVASPLELLRKKKRKKKTSRYTTTTTMSAHSRVVETKVETPSEQASVLPKGSSLPHVHAVDRSHQRPVFIIGVPVRTELFYVDEQGDNSTCSETKSEHSSSNGVGKRHARCHTHFNGRNGSRHCEIESHHRHLCRHRSNWSHRIIAMHSAGFASESSSLKRSDHTIMNNEPTNGWGGGLSMASRSLRNSPNASRVSELQSTL